MTPQEIFDKVWDHLNKQGRPARSGIGGCQYRTDEGLACAVGCLVDDDTAKRWDEYVDPCIDAVANADEDAPVFIRANTDFLSDIQQAHDLTPPMGGDWLTEWRYRMSRIATRHHLTIPEIPQ